MKRQFRRRFYRLPLLPVVLPAASIGLLAWVLPSAQAQEASAPGLPASLPTAQVAPQSDPAIPQAQPPSPTEPQNPRASAVIDEIKVVGNKYINEVAIISLSRHNVGDPFNQDTLDAIRKNLYATGLFGYLANPEAVRVEGVSTPEGKNTVVITLEENAPVQWDAIEITGSGPIPPEEIRNLITRTPVYNVLQFERNAEAIQELYAQRGYTAVVLPEDNFDPATGILRVPILVTRVAEIVIAGNRKTQRKTILREMRTKEGDFFDRNTFYRRDRPAIFNLNLFEDVSVEERELGPGRIGLTISVTEQRSGNVLVGVGFSNRAQIIGFADISENNFRGLAQTVALRWETGGAVGRNSVIATFSDPWIDKRRTSLTVQVYDQVVYRFSQRLSSAAPGQVAGSDNRYNEQRTGGTVTVSRPGSDPRIRVALSIRGENVRPDPLGIDIVRDAPILQNGPLLALTGTLTRNTRDLDLDPIRGGLDSVSLQVGFANLSPVRLPDGTETSGALGSTTFSKVSIDIRRFFSLAGPRDPIRDPVGLKTTLAFRLFAGTTVGRLPFFEQFFLGGAESLRGYREDRFWGTNTFLFSGELRQPLARSLRGVLFLDVGAAWGGQFEDVTLVGFTQTRGFNPHVGFGAGLRVVTPIGPLRLDFGIGDEGTRTHFSIGNTF